MYVQASSSLVQHAIQVVEVLRPIVGAVTRRDRDLGSRMRRAASSIALNLAEGFGSGSGNSRLRFDSAFGSVCEVQASMRLAIAWGYVSVKEAADAVAALEHLGRRVHGM